MTYEKVLITRGYTTSGCVWDAAMWMKLDDGRVISICDETLDVPRRKSKEFVVFVYYPPYKEWTVDSGEAPDTYIFQSCVFVTILEALKYVDLVQRMKYVGMSTGFKSPSHFSFGNSLSYGSSQGKDQDNEV